MADKSAAPAPRAPRPNYNRIHALPLPLRVHPLPTLYPHNPLSVLSVVLTYIFQALFSHSSSPQTPYRGYFSAETRSVHVTESSTIRALWEMGFFGKGSLSRSEPNWLDKEKRKRGLLAQETSEEVTRRRRQERQEFKNERARKEREAIDERLKEEGKLSKIKDVAADAASNGSTNPEDVGLIRPFVGDGRASKLTLASEAETVAPETALSDTQPKEPVSLQTSSKKRSGFGRNTNVPSQGQSSVPLLDLEHLQLTMEEAFFLVYGVGVLEITAEGGSLTISVLELLSLFRQHSYFPPSPTPPVAPDDPFLISYVVYHHFRSLGWVVRPGIKFAVDYLLYNRGPVFAHAEFAVMIIPSYASAAEPDPSSRRVDFPRKDRRDWWWLHCVNRVQAQVHKTLVLVYVEVPLLEPEDLAEAQGVTGITRLLQRYKVREMMLKRWTPNRSRD